ncbi:hypothetical protein NE236_26295 [Actinoallomurus purpureus]|uniref:hypothetical protein n=1 Tax=Actinoallomurus purpureus TaxID=478114 RepID=UPI002092B5B5|nr:hypothetical protein [Actinoallomurus purpureus]MCO6008492.1 hypothetical protein [Actinoallomurus purpureus]
MLPPFGNSPLRPPTTTAARCSGRSTWRTRCWSGWLYEGIRNYKHLYGEDEFHEACEYFYVHIGEAEKEHREQAVVSAAQLCRTGADFEREREAFDGFLDLTARYWAGVHGAMLAA